MMLQVIVYVSAVAAVLSVVGICAERLARLHRLPGRAVWAAAMLLSMLLPAAMILLARPAEIRNVPVTIADQDAPYINPEPADFGESPAAQLPAQALPSDQSVRLVPEALSASVAPRSTWKLPRPSDRLLVTMWMTASSALALYLLCANLLLRRRMKGWHSATVQDHQVLISEVTGPALLGAFSPRIVVPRWLLLQPHGTQALILQHEQQHVQARDALLIMAGLVAIVAVPWNLPLWWQWRRLRQAIEMDCDARVLRAGAEANSYAEVLLAVTQRSRRVPAGALAMSEPVHALERRIANLLPDATRYARLQTIAVLLLAAAGAGAALALEAPALPGRAAVPTSETPRDGGTPAAGDSASPATVGTSARATIMAAAAPATRVPDSPQAAQTQVLAHLATQPAPFVVRILPPVAEPSPFALRVTGDRASPPPSGGADAAVRARLERYYAVLVEKLGAVPGLQLITEATAGVPDVSYEISMGLGADWKGVVTVATSVQNPSVRKLTATRDALFGIVPAEARDALPANDPDRDMDRFVENMRLELFGADRSLVDQKLSELRDPKLRPFLRAQALGQLMKVDSLYDSTGARMDSFAGRVMGYTPDPALLEAATEVAMTDRDPELRSSLWNTLAGSAPVPGIPYPGNTAMLAAPAGRALASETDLHVQLLLVRILSRNAEDPQASAALESAASNGADINRPELVRMAARRALDGGAGWNDYFLARLRDPRVPDAERVELIQHAYLISNSSRWAGPGGRMQLDEAAARSLGSLLNSSASTEVVAAAVSLLTDPLVLRSAEKAVSRVAYEELLEFLRAGTGKPGADPRIRSSVLRQLVLDLSLHPEARPVFEQIAARDNDPALRERARQALEQTPLR